MQYITQKYVTQKYVTHSLWLLFGLCALGLAALTTAPARAAAPEWSRHFGGPGHDEPGQVVTDSARNVIVVGTSDRSLFQLDFRILKYSPSGHLLWTRRYNGTNNGYDLGVSVDVDAADNIYITGTSDSSTTGYDIVTLKYSPDGTELWRQRFDGGGTNDYAGVLKVSRAGDVYVAGEVVTDSYHNALYTLKYDTNGNKLWGRRFNVPIPLQNDSYLIGYNLGGMVLDQDGNAYITDEVEYYDDYYANEEYAAQVTKYLSDGTRAWTRIIANPIAGEGVSSSIATDPDGNVIVGTTSYDNSAETFLVSKYSPNGQQLWQSRPQFSGTDAFLQALSVDSDGNIVAAGYSGDFTGSGLPTYYFVITKLDSEGTQVWAETSSTVYSSFNGWKFYLALDAGGNAFLTGTSSLGSGEGSTVTQKYAADSGSLLWSDTQNLDGNTNSEGVTVDKSGAAIVIARKPGAHGNGDFAIFKYAP